MDFLFDKILPVVCFFSLLIGLLSFIALIWSSDAALTLFLIRIMITSLILFLCSVYLGRIIQKSKNDK